MMAQFCLKSSQADAEFILKSKDIYRTICDDGSPSREDMVIPDGWVNVVAYVDDKPAGCFVLHKQNCITMECHVQILAEYRHLSKEMSDAMLAWVWDNTPAQKLIANIPFDCENVKNFAEIMGFKIEGVNEDSIMKNGKVLSQWYLGLRKWQ